jgi:hypothetical protein
MTKVRMGRDAFRCPIHGRQIRALEAISSMHFRFDCDVCGDVIMYTGCYDCMSELVRSCSECGDHFCLNCGHQAATGRHASTPMCNRCLAKYPPQGR